MSIVTMCEPLERVGDVAQFILSHVPSGVLILRGDLASGKTTLVKALASAMGVDETVTSPTFSLQQVYGERLYHYDLYNHGLDHFMGLGMFEELEKSGLHCIEWGDAALAQLLVAGGLQVATVEIEKESEERCYRITYA